MQKVKNKTRDEGIMRDIQDRTEYKKHQGFISKSPANVTLMCNTDGVSIYRSSKTSIWPILLAINELPPNMRLVLFLGIIMNIHKPYFSFFLCTFDSASNICFLVDSGMAQKNLL